MSQPISGDAFAHFFAAAPWVLGIAIITTAYLMWRGSEKKGAPIGQTFACASCGRRGVREHMIPATHEGAVSWYCAKCVDNH